MADRETVYAHQVQRWKAGDLRKALEGVPDDADVEVSTLEEPSSSPRKPVLEADRLVLIAADWERDSTADGGRVLVLYSDFPPRDDYIYTEKGW